MNKTSQRFTFLYVKIIIILVLCFYIQSFSQETDEAKLKQLKEGIVQFIPMVQGDLTCSVKDVSVSTDNRNRELVLILLVKVRKDIIRYTADEIRAIGGKIPNEPVVPEEKTGKVGSLGRLVGGLFGFICTKSKVLNIKANTQKIILLDQKGTPVNSISGNRQNIYDAGITNDLSRLFLIMTIKDL